MKENKLQIKNTVNAEKLERFLLDLSKSSRSTFNHFGDINKKNIKQIVNYELKRRDKLKFFSSINNQLVGYSFLTKFAKSTKKHNCILGIVISDSFQNIGIGKTMCKHMIKTAWKKGITKIWLNVFYDNKKAFRLYKSLGFQVEGIFIDDEIFGNKKRHVISMALIKNKDFEFNQRLKLIKKLSSI